MPIIFIAAVLLALSAPVTAQLWVDDDFSSDTMSNYEVKSGSATISGGELHLLPNTALLIKNLTTLGDWCFEVTARAAGSGWLGFKFDDMPPSDNGMMYYGWTGGFAGIFNWNLNDTMQVYHAPPGQMLGQTTVTWKCFVSPTSGALEVWGNGILYFDLDVTPFGDNLSGGSFQIITNGIAADLSSLRIGPAPAVDYIRYEQPAGGSPAPDLFPRSATPVETLDYVSLRSSSMPDKLLGTVAQGLINRSQPRVYNDFQSYAGGNVSNDWKFMLEEQGYQFQPITKTDLVTKYRDEFAGVVIYDSAWWAGAPNQHWRNRINAVSTICSVSNAIPLTPSQNSSWNTNAGGWNLPVLLDTRVPAGDGSWSDGYATYKWVYDHCWDQCNHTCLAHDYPDNVESRDYYVQHKVFTFLTVECTSRERYAFYLGLMQQTAGPGLLMGINGANPHYGSIYGSWGENSVFSYAAQFGGQFQYTFTTSNMSVHSGLPIQQLSQPRTTALPLVENKVYVCWAPSENDNLTLATMLVGRKDQKLRWFSPSRGQVKYGWGVTPAMGALTPDILEYYYLTASEDDGFFADGNGLAPVEYLNAGGVRYPANQRPAIKGNYFDWTEEYVQRCDLKVMRNWPRRITGEISAMLTGVSSLWGLMPDYGRFIDSYAAANSLVNGKPVLRAVTSGSNLGNEEDYARQMADQIRTQVGSTRPAFVHGFITGNSITTYVVKRIMEILDTENPGQFVDVTPEQLVRLYARHRNVDVEPPSDWGRLQVVAGGQEPTLRVTVADNRGLNCSSGAYYYSDNGGVSFAGPFSAQCSGTTLTAMNVAFGPDRDQNLVYFKIADTAGNVSSSPYYRYHSGTALARRWEFNRAQQLEGRRYGRHQVGPSSVAAGRWSLFAQGGDPQVEYEGNLNWPADSGDILRIRMHVSGSGSCTPQLFFHRTDQAGYTGEQMCSWNVTRGGGYREYVVTLGTMPGWSGTMANLRFDPSNEAAPDARVNVDWIRLERSEAYTPSPTDTPTQTPEDTLTPTMTGPNMTATITALLGCLGDADRNRFVNAADFACVRDHYGQPGWIPGDANADGFVNASDYRAVRENFGQNCDH